MINIIFGNDEYAKKECEQQIVADAEICKFNLENKDISLLLSEVAVVDFFVSKKVYVLENAHLLFKSGVYGKFDFTLMQKIFSYNETFIIKLDKSPAKSSKFFKSFSDQIKLFECEMKKQSTQISIDSFIEKHNILIEKEALQLVQSNLDDETQLVTTELLKLFTWTAGQMITVADVELVSSKSVKTKIFDLYTLIIQGQNKKAYEMYEMLIEEGNEASNLLLTSFSIIVRFYAIKKLSERTTNAEQIAKRVNVSSYVVKMNQRVVSTIPIENIEKLIHKLAEADYRFKTGQNSPESCLEYIILS